MTQYFTDKEAMRIICAGTTVRRESAFDLDIKLPRGVLTMRRIRPGQPRPWEVFPR